MSDTLRNGAAPARRRSRDWLHATPTLKQGLWLAAFLAIAAVLLFSFVTWGQSPLTWMRAADKAPEEARSDAVEPSKLGAYTVERERITIDDLPGEFYVAPIAGLDDTEALAAKRDLVLDGAVLVISENPGNHLNREIAANRLVLRNGARIVTAGSSFRITASQLVAERGEIVAFEEAFKPKDTGRGGASGGGVEIATVAPLRGRLTVRLNGQDGSDGAAGEAGFTGGFSGAVSMSEDPIQAALDCEAIAAAQSSSGGEGGRGQDGGDAGNGGVLHLIGGIARSRDNIAFQALPGKPGEGGKGGPGGVAGAVAPLPEWCAGVVQPVRVRASGPAGQNGVKGLEGVPGRILISEQEPRG